MSKISFEAWMILVNQELARTHGITVECLPDCDYWSEWDSGTTAKVMARKAIKNANECF